MMQAAALLHLLQFASPALPIGAYSYSQGLEAALEEGLVRDAATARSWIVSHLLEVVARWEAPVCWRLMQAFEQQDLSTVPLGQVAGQRLLLSLRPELEAAALLARTLADEEIGNWTPGLSLLSMRHELQYSRLYRS